MKKVFIIHGWGGKPSSDWIPYLKKELEIKGYNVTAPTMPNTEKPKIHEWLNHLNKTVKKIDEDTYFVGHSMGCQAIMRFLENYNIQVTKVVFVAGWFKLDNLEDKEVEDIAKPWIETPTNFDKVKKNIKELKVFLSSNEPYGFVKENKKIFEKKLNAKVIIEKNKGHFTKDDGITQIPEVLNEL